MDLIINLKFLSIKRTIAISRQWIQFIVIAVVILASTVISFWGNSALYMILLSLLGTIVVIFALVRQPSLGFILVFLGGMFVRIVGPSELSAATVMVAIMLGLWIMDMLVVQKKIQFIRSSIMIPIFTFLVITILAFFVGQIPWFVFARQAPLNAQVGGFAIFVFSIGGMLLAAHLIKDMTWLKNIVWVFIGLFAIYIICLVFGLYIYGGFFFFVGFFQQGFIAQSMSWTWLVALVAGQIIYNNKLTRLTRGMLIVLIVLTFYVSAFLNFDWKSGWVPPVVALVALLAIRYRRLVIFIIPLVSAFVVYVTADLIAADSYSWGTRLDAWRIILEISRVSPLLGMGFANYYWYTPLFPIRGWRVNFNSHSQFVDLLAQMGYVGLFVFLWLFFELGRLTWTVARKLPDGFARGYSYGVLAGLIATMVAAFLGDWLLPFVYNVGLNGFRASILPWIFIGGVISLEQMLREPSADPEKKFS